MPTHNPQPASCCRSLVLWSLPAQVVPLSQIAMFDPYELELLIGGIDEIDTQDWYEHTTYTSDYTRTTPAVEFFWRFVLTLDSEMKSRLLQFITGTSRVPIGGFAELHGSQGPRKFCISRGGLEVESLPKAHTCFNRLDLPPYADYATLRKKLLQALEFSSGYGGVD